MHPLKSAYDVTNNSWKNAKPAALRAAIRRGEWKNPTTGLAQGYVQANLVILPQVVADEFAEFCALNAQACPLLEQTCPGDPVPRLAALEADLRTDVPRYRIFRKNVVDQHEPTSILDFWRDDFVCFLLGCSFTFENALIREGLSLRHFEQGRNVSMYRTNIACQSSGRFSGEMVVSMRPFQKHQIDQVTAITQRFPKMHGGPVHIGSAQDLGIADLSRPDFGDAVDIAADEVPVFWACGVTPQVALSNAGLDLAITHSPGCMFVTDWQDTDFEQTISSHA